jgi:hypothetical protein
MALAIPLVNISEVEWGDLLHGQIADLPYSCALEENSGSATMFSGQSPEKHNYSPRKRRKTTALKLGT